MRILRVFPRKTNMTPNDDMVLVGDPPLDKPEANEVHVSVSFTWDRERAERLQQAWGQYYPIVKIGGPAYDNSCDGFTPGLYVKHGVIFTSRGCLSRCPWCEAWRREGKIRELPIYEGNIVRTIICFSVLDGISIESLIC